MALSVLSVDRISILDPNRQAIFRGTSVSCINVATVQNAYTTTIWASNWNPPPQGGVNVPFALMVDAHNQDTQIFNIEVTGGFPFPPEWINLQNQPGFFKIKLTDQNGVSLLSELYPVIDPANPNPTTFFVQHFKLELLANGPIFGPFKSRLNWKLSIISCNGLGAPEGFFFVGSLHRAFSQSFPHGHRLEIIRSSVLDIVDYLEEHSTIQYKQRAAKNIAKEIWDKLSPRLRYDVFEGRGRCGLSHYGGKLDLTVVLEAPDLLVNCYDLAGISQAWCASLGKAGNQAAQIPTAVLETAWAYSGEWFGYVTEGPLFGRVSNVADNQKKCNNPFWGHSGQPWYAQADLMEPDRNPFGNHAWVEVQIENGQARQVLEICHAHVDLTNLANVTLCNADITRDKWIGRAVNVGLETNANIDNWKPIAIDRNGLALEMIAPGVTRYVFMPRGSHGLGGFVG
ncbi:hypothetical protein FGSG_10710 [Fusarium graminearum PH-1]|uniref:Chromosome 1, complete genome n=1 Tax=Gibberella zeae (strain ATCC MYA-4620 / CBS 123657 / FGSC 9075 / NRRL 31084 / PH-1) TaxID=229533 RepID=I1S1U0_GIBZE|nr:hypothetical protein FGSG_10710 [Fusarium graminearum PH-1]ESU17461.1 hypothetical protein FGSG_10710 [Fusarium graminearum PH-1]CAF3434923.1 unnamed protein product [Fusarium graminearum]CEF76180.1 unnamed protein product [Fusarium graminearum]|eukprot:XP_011319723.1 hypothetical protein FGSG_10710 [Fusarium graminearum PH-1]